MSNSYGIIPRRKIPKLGSKNDISSHIWRSLDIYIWSKYTSNIKYHFISHSQFIAHNYSNANGNSGKSQLGDFIGYFAKYFSWLFHKPEHKILPEILSRIFVGFRVILSNILRVRNKLILDVNITFGSPLPTETNFT